VIPPVFTTQFTYTTPRPFVPPTRQSTVIPSRYPQIPSSPNREPSYYDQEYPRPVQLQVTILFGSSHALHQWLSKVFGIGPILTNNFFLGLVPYHETTEDRVRILKLKMLNNNDVKN
jgi:hypothetical protein